MSKTKQTITEDYILSHFHANYCTGGKPIQKGNVGKTLRFLFRDPNSVFKEVKYVAYQTQASQCNSRTTKE